MFWSSGRSGSAPSADLRGCGSPLPERQVGALGEERYDQRMSDAIPLAAVFNRATEASCSVFSGTILIEHYPKKDSRAYRLSRAKSSSMFSAKWPNGMKRKVDSK